MMSSKGENIEMNQQKIGKFFKELRNEKNLTQEQLGEVLGVSRRTVSRWETGSNMPDLDILIEMADYYDVDLRELLDGERKSEKMNEEMKETLEKVANYNEMLNLKSMQKGIITMSIVFIIMVLISSWKELSPAPLVSMLCAYNFATFICKAKDGKNKTDFITGSLFFIAMLLNTIAFVLM